MSVEQIALPLIRGDLVHDSQEIGHLPNKFADKLTHLRERLRSRLTNTNLNPAKNYVERNGFEILMQFTPHGSSQQYEALISRVPAIDDLNSGAPSQLSEDMTASDWCYFENLVHVSGSETAESPEWLAILSAVRIKLPDQVRYALGKSHYFSLKTSLNHWSISATRGRKDRRAVSGNGDELHNVIENAPEFNDDSLRVGAECDQSSDIGLPLFRAPDWIPPNHEIYDLFCSVAIYLGADCESVEAQERSDLPIQIRDIYFGPLGFLERPF